MHVYKQRFAELKNITRMEYGATLNLSSQKWLLSLKRIRPNVVQHSPRAIKDKQNLFSNWNVLVLLFLHSLNTEL